MSTISFLAGLGAGYMDRQDKEADRARRDRLDQITFDRAGRETEQYNQGQADRTAIRTAAAPLPVTTTTDLPDNIDVGQPGETNPQPVYRVGAQRFANQGVAAQAANDPAAADARVSQALRGIDPMRAQEYERGADSGKLAKIQLQQALKHAQDEGTGRALNMALSLGPGGAKQVMDTYNASGGEKITDLQIIPIEVDHPVLGKRPSVRLVGKTADGAPFEVPDALDASFKLFSAEKQFDMLVKAKDTAKKDAKDERTLTMQEGAATALAEYHRALAKSSQTRADRPAGSKGLDPEDRMSEPDKEEYRGIKDQIKTINSEITKAQASDAWNPESANAKALNARLIGLNLRGKKILDAYAAEDAAPADPLGIRKPKAAPAAPGGGNPGMVPTSVQSDRDAEAGRLIIRSELGNDPNRVQAEVARIDASLKADKGAPAEARNMLQQKRAILVAGAASMAAQPAAATRPVAPVASPAGMAAQGIAPPPAERVPGPPPQFGFNGNPRAPNPAFVAWQKQFGQAWQAQQAADEAALAQERAAAQATVDRARSAPGMRGNV